MKHLLLLLSVMLGCYAQQTSILLPYFSSGTGSPTGTCSLNTAFIQTDASSGSWLWLCVSGTWVHQTGGGGSSSAGTVGVAQASDGAGGFQAGTLNLATVAQLAGVELITNGDFASGLTGWTVSGDGTGWSIVGGHLHHTPGTANKIATTVTVQGGSLYSMQWTVVSQSAGSSYLDFGEDCNTDCTYNSVVGANTYEVVSDNDNGAIVIEIVPSSNSDVTLSLVSLLEPQQMIYRPGLASSNVVAGHRALFSNTTGSSNEAYGTWALYSNATGRHNIGIGFKALYTNVTGSDNVAVGHRALALGTGNFNVALGSGSLSQSSTGYSNASLGTGAMSSNTTGFSNVAVGNSSLSGNIGGAYNVALGDSTCRLVTTGDHNVCLGNGAGPTSNQSNKLFIDVTERNDPLIGGDFSARTIALNGNATITGKAYITQQTPASAAEACVANQFAYDTGFLYVCTATNTWKRSLLTTW